MVASASFKTFGGGTDHLCLPYNPDRGNYNTSAAFVSWIRNVEYITCSYGIFSSYRHKKHAVCSVCYTQTRPAVHVFPGWRSCPSGWTREYYGYMMASAEHYLHPSNYVCVDTNPDYKHLANSGQGGGLTFVNIDCEGEGSIEVCSGSSQYVHRRQLTCVVCSR